MTGIQEVEWVAGCRRTSWWRLRLKLGGLCENQQQLLYSATALPSTSTHYSVLSFDHLTKYSLPQNETREVVLENSPFLSPTKLCSIYPQLIPFHLNTVVSPLAVR